MRKIPLISFAVALILIAVAKPVRADDCHNPDYVRSFDPRLAGRICTEVTTIPIRWSGGSANFRVLAADDVRGSRSNIVVSWIREAAGRIAGAMDQMGGMRLDNPTIMITNLDGGAGWAQVDPGHQPYAGQCLAIAYNFDPTYDSDAAKFVLAHETFHCIQLATWPGSLNRSHERDWWVEGSAEYFANLAVPLTRLSNRFVPQFQSRALTTSLLDMAYDNEVFFSWVAEHNGARGVKSFIDAVAPGMGREAYRTNAESALSPDDWKDFAIAAATDSIHLPGSADGVGLDQSAIPRGGLTNGETHLERDPLVMLVRALVPEPAGVHHLHVVATPRPYGATLDLSSSSGWGELPETLDVPCDSERPVFVAAMTAAARGQDIRIQDRVQRRECEERPGPRTIVGTWEMTPDSLQRDVTLMNERTLICQVTNGKFQMTFNPDNYRSTAGTGTFNFINITFRCDPPAGSGKNQFVRTINGTAAINWQVTENHLIIGFRKVFQVIGNIRTEVHYRVAPYRTPNPEIKNEPLYANVGLGPWLGGVFRVGGNSLHIDDARANYQLDFTRIDEPPRRRP